METIKQNIHRGKILQEAVEATGLNKNIIAQKAGYKRVTYYLHIKQKDLSLNILQKYSKAMGHDFSEEIPDIKPLLMEEPETTYFTKPKNLQQAIEQIDYWKNRYLSLLEKCMVEKEKKDN